MTRRGAAGAGVLAVAALLAAPAWPAPDPVTVARGFIDRLAEGDFAAAVASFDATMRGVLPEAKLGELWSGLQEKVGALVAQESARVEPIGAYRAVFVTCRFARATLDVKVVLDADGAIAGLFFVPARPAVAWTPPADCADPAAREVARTVGVGEWALPGTLTLPPGDGPFPAVVLVHGSGPHDRDETLGPNKPFADLACGLAARGVATLRYVKRTAEYAARLSTTPQPSFTVQDETVDDAVAAIAAARAAPGIDPRRVVVLGHSLGGMLAPRIASRAPELAGVVVLAGTARPLEEVILEQLAYVKSLGDTKDTEAAKALDAMAAEVARLRELDASDAGSGALLLGAPASYWLDLRGYRPADAARKLPQPMLFLQGERDYQVTMADFRIWQAALGERDDVRFVSFPDLNHLFMTGEGKATPAEYERAGHVAEEVVGVIAEWVKSLGPD